MLLLRHSNIGFDFGELNRLFTTTDLHRWHHSAHPDEGMLNLGRALVVRDQVFGTWLRPPARAAPARIGLFAASRLLPPATDLRGQLAWPFTPARCRAQA